MGADSAALRLLLDRHVLSELAGHTHRELSGACAGIGLPALPTEGTKRERLDASLAALPDAEGEISAWPAKRIRSGTGSRRD